MPIRWREEKEQLRYKLQGAESALKARDDLIEKLLAQIDDPSRDDITREDTPAVAEARRLIEQPLEWKNLRIILLVRMTGDIRIRSNENLSALYCEFNPLFAKIVTRNGDVVGNCDKFELDGVRETTR